MIHVENSRSLLQTVAKEDNTPTQISQYRTHILVYDFTKQQKPHLKKPTTIKSKIQTNDIKENLKQAHSFFFL